MPEKTQKNEDMTCITVGAANNQTSLVDATVKKFLTRSQTRKLWV